MFNVRFNFRDSRGRNTSRTIHNTNTLIADVITDVGVLALAWNPLTDLQLVDVTITTTDASGAFAGAAVSNIDENVSVRAQGGDGRVYDFDLPDMPDAKMPTDTLDITDVDVTTFFAEFAAGNNWRVNLNNPTDIVSLINGRLDK